MNEQNSEEIIYIYTHTHRDREREREREKESERERERESRSDRWVCIIRVENINGCKNVTKKNFDTELFSDLFMEPHYASFFFLLKSGSHSHVLNSVLVC